MKVAIAEPYLQDYTGHYYNVVSELKQGFEKLGDQVSVFVPQDCKAEGCWEKSMPPQFSGLQRASSLGRIIGHYRYILSFARWLSNIGARHDIIVITSANDWRIICAASLCQCRKPIYLYLHTLELSKRKTIKRLLRPVLTRRQTSLCFMVPFPVTKGELRDLIGAVDVPLVDNAPYPIMAPIKIGKYHQEHQGQRLCIAYLGDARREKGFVSIVDFAVRHSQQYDFIIQCNVPTSGADEPDVAAAIHRLKGIKRDNVTILDHPLSNEEYFSWMGKSSVVVCIYDRSAYSHRVSGILLEAFALGKPVIVTDGTWLARQVKRYGGGVIIDDPSAENLLAAVEKIKVGYSRFSTEAAKAGQLLLQTNSGLALAQSVRATLGRDSSGGDQR